MNLCLPEGAKCHHEIVKFNHETGEHFEIDGAEIYVEETGDKNAPVLLFLHGGFGNIEDFNSVLPLFENEFRAIGIDSRGQGKSTLGEGIYRNGSEIYHGNIPEGFDTDHH